MVGRRPGGQQEDLTAGVKHISEQVNKVQLNKIGQSTVSKPVSKVKSVSKQASE